MLFMVRLLPGIAMFILSSIPLAISIYLISWLFAAITDIDTDKYRWPNDHTCSVWFCILLVSYLVTLISGYSYAEQHGGGTLGPIVLYSLASVTIFMAAVAVLVGSCCRAYKFFETRIAARNDAATPSEEEGVPLNNASSSQDQTK